MFFYSFHETNNLIWKFIDVVNMAMFMFISGFFWGTPTAEGILKRLRTLILLTLGVGLCYTLMKERRFESFLHHQCIMAIGSVLHYFIFIFLLDLQPSRKIFFCRIWTYNKVVLSIEVILVLVYDRFFFQDDIIVNALSIL